MQHVYNYIDGFSVVTSVNNKTEQKNTKNKNDWKKKLFDQIF